MILVLIMVFSAVAIADSHEDTNGDDEDGDDDNGASNRDRENTVRDAQKRFSDRIREAGDNFVERAREFRDKHQARIDALEDKRQELRDAVGERRRNAIKPEVKVRAKDAITSNIDRVIERLLAARENADGRSIERIDDLIEKFENKRANLGGQDINGTTIIAINNQVNNEAENAVHESKTHFVRAILKQFDRLITKLDRFSNRLSNVADRLEGNGADVSLLREIIANLDSQISTRNAARESLADRSEAVYGFSPGRSKLDG